MIKRLRIEIYGMVQGVGFRPFVFNLASGMRLSGYVLNHGQGVEIEVEGENERLKEFLSRLSSEKPKHSFFQSFETCLLEPAGLQNFEIRKSRNLGDPRALVLPDIATCPDCLSEIFDPNNRRFHYPFTNCTLCGPRYTIIEKLPYDRPNTSMKGFTMCEACLSEYKDPTNRRFHAQPNACPECGPRLSFIGQSGDITNDPEEALKRTIEALLRGLVVAIKGIGGFHLMVDATRDEAVLRLRRKKGREEKPFALMFGDLEQLMRYCETTQAEQELLTSSIAPILLLDKVAQPGLISKQVAPNNPRFGVMLPYSPLHHLLTAKFGLPLVATSGNLSDDPIQYQNESVLEKLGKIADCFLLHDRPILRPVDDSIFCMLDSGPQVFRRARGLVPLPIPFKKLLPDALAVGGQLKNTLALSKGNNVFISQHLGDLDNRASLSLFQKTVEDLKGFYNINPQTVLTDLHPDFASSRYARTLNIPVRPVQHHVAHMLSCAIENDAEPPLLGVCWDGTGFGEDGTIWGGEFFVLDENKVRRVGHLTKFYLPGAEVAVKQPRRTAIGLLYALFGASVFQEYDLPCTKGLRPDELDLVLTACEKGIHSPETSSMGRLFDAVASLCGLCQINRFEGQAAQMLEYVLPPTPSSEAYPLAFSSVINLKPMMKALLEDLAHNAEAGRIASRFHEALIGLVVKAVLATGQNRVVLSGGCFQNRYLTHRLIQHLEKEGCKVYRHQKVPPNDGGISLGQMASMHYLKD